MPEYIYCEECGEEAAQCIGGQGTDGSPYQWECADCGFLFATNDANPDT